MIEPLYTTWHTSIVDGYDHAVTDEEMAAGGAARCQGRRAAVCGDVVLCASLCSPPGPRCARCAAFLHARAAASDAAQRATPRHRRPGLIARLLRRGTSSRAVRAKRTRG
ncbi:MAG: hypothetical protein ACRDRH_01005 [Pseudonocardia sp.]